MPLDNAKLERAVNTTEKLVKRMDALESRRNDAIDPKLSEARKKEYEEAKAVAKSNYDKYWSGSASASLSRDVKSGRGKVVGRKDDYGHPVKSNNRVQQTDYGQEADNKMSVDARRGQEDRGDSTDKNTHGVQYKSKKDGGMKTEWYDSESEAETACSVMKDKGHPDARMVHRS